MPGATAHAVSRAVLGALAIMSTVQRVSASRVNYQFEHVKDYQNSVIRWAFIYDNGCKNEYETYRNASIPDEAGLGHEKAFRLIDCLLAATPEAFKLDMASTGIILGLLPALLSQVGPTIAEVGLLALQRPLLAFLLGCGSPSLTSGHNELYGRPAIALNTPVRVSPRLTEKPTGWVEVATSLAEYLIAMAAVANILYFAYRLVFHAVCWSAIQLYSPNVPETAVPFIWVLLTPAAQIIGFVLVHSRVRRPPVQSVAAERGDGGRRYGLTLKRWLRREVRPCAYGEPLSIEERRPGGWLVFMEHGINFLVIAQLIMGTVILSTTMFLGLRTAVEMVVQVLLGVEPAS